MLENIEDGTAAAERLVRGAPLQSGLLWPNPLAGSLDAGVREVAWHRPQFSGGGVTCGARGRDAGLDGLGGGGRGVVGHLGRGLGLRGRITGGYGGVPATAVLEASLEAVMAAL